MIEAQFPLPLLLAAERIINQTMGQDPVAKGRMIKLSGLVFEIHLTTLHLHLYLTPTASGSILLRRDFEGMTDAQITTSTFGLLRAQQAGEGMDALFSGDIRIDGNQNAAESLLHAFSDLDIDVFALLADRIGVAPAGLIERRAQTFKKRFSEWRRTRQIEQTDFLIYESRLLIDRDEVQTWMDDVDAVRDHVDQLASRLNRLAQYRSAIEARS